MTIPPLTSQLETTAKPSAQTLKKSKAPVWLGGAAASMSACITHPLDQTKYRMQVVSSRVNLLRAVYQFAARDGVFSLWQGLSASILRQSTYSTARFALYEKFSKRLNSLYLRPGEHPTLGMTMTSSGLAGAMAGVIGNPAEIVLVRMCADGAKPIAERYAYSNALTGLIQIARVEGVRTFARGLGPNVIRSVLMNCSQIATYTEIKKTLLTTRRLNLKDDTLTHSLASLVAGTIATTVCAPADVLKSRFQNAGGSQKVSMVPYIVQTVRTEGAGFLMKGWTPAWLRLAPNTMLTFVFMEKLKAFFVEQ